MLENFFDHYAMGKRRLVINLGCGKYASSLFESLLSYTNTGSDVLPFEMLKKKPECCQNATFVDIDYPTLMKKKCETITQTGELSDLLDKVTLTDQDEGVLLRSEQYVAVGCDLCDIERLDDVIRTEFPVSDSVFLFIAEVSITYMDTSSANALIEWASTLGDSKNPKSFQNYQCSGLNLLSSILFA